MLLVYDCIAADRATKRILFTVSWVLDAQWTLANTKTFGQFFFFLPGYVISSTLAFVTVFAEMRVSPAEPLRDRTAVLAFKLNKVGAVLCTLCASDTKFFCCTCSANQIFRLKFLLFLLSSDAVFHSAEIRFLTTKAQIIGALEDSVLG